MENSGENKENIETGPPLFKKRRGRPPKFLEVWNQQAALNYASKMTEQKEENIGSRSPSPEIDVVTTKDDTVNDDSKKRKRKKPEVDELSLRKFFEAGGRDYNEYLEWRKNNGTFPPTLSAPTEQKVRKVNKKKTPTPPPPPPYRPATTMYYTQAGLPLNLPAAQSYHPMFMYKNTYRSATSPTPISKDDSVLDLSTKKMNDSGFEEEHSNSVLEWNVDKVCDFVQNVSDCSEYVNVFREHKIDGNALPHLSDEQMVKCMGMKMGPVIKLRLAISKLLPNEEKVTQIS